MDHLVRSRRHSLFFALSGPGGVGKTSLIKRWREGDPSIGYVRNVTTRPQREYDASSGVNDADWFEFVSEEAFRSMIKSNSLVQWSHASAGYLSGTPLEPVHRAIADARDLVFDYTPQLYFNLKAVFPDRVIGIAVVPPTFSDLVARLRNRGSDRGKSLDLKVEMGRQDLCYLDQHDYILVNHHLTEALAGLQSIRTAERLRRANVELNHEALSKASPKERPMLFYYDPGYDRSNFIATGFRRAFR